jgi:hypothetical protein
MAQLDMQQCAVILKARGLGVQSFIALSEEVGFDYMDGTDNGERISEEDLERWLAS